MPPLLLWKRALKSILPYQRLGGIDEDERQGWGAMEEVHKQLAVDLFNHTWTLLDKADRTLDEDEEMLMSAWASRFHWSKVGTPLNAARGEWQISRVYSVLGRAEPALHHAHRTLELCERYGYGDFDLAFAYEALARAHAVAGNRAERDRYYQRGIESAEGIKDKDDKELFLSDLNSVP